MNNHDKQFAEQFLYNFFKLDFIFENIDRLSSFLFLLKCRSNDSDLKFAYDQAFQKAAEINQSIIVLKKYIKQIQNIINGEE